MSRILDSGSVISVSPETPALPVIHRIYMSVVNANTLKEIAQVNLFGEDFPSKVLAEAVIESLNVQTVTGSLTGRYIRMQHEMTYFYKGYDLLFVWKKERV